MKNLLMLPALALAAFGTAISAHSEPSSLALGGTTTTALTATPIDDLGIRPPTPSMQPVCVPHFCCYYGENGDWWGCSKQV